MKISRFLLVFFACLTAWAAAAFFAPAPVQSTYRYGITLTPTEEVTPTVETPTEIPTEIPVITDTPDVPTPTLTVTPDPGVETPTPTPTIVPDEGSEGSDRPPAEVLPRAGIRFGAPDSAAFDLLPSHLLARPVARIAIARLGLDVPVRPVWSDGYSWDITRLGGAVGWLAETTHPGEEGNAVLVGHVSDLHALPPFRDLETLQPGDTIRMITAQWTSVYTVSEQFHVDDQNLSILASGQVSQLTLVTCADWDIVAQRYRSRLVVQTEFVERYPTIPGSW